MYTMTDEQKSKASTVISIRAEEQLKERITEEAVLRGHTMSEAAEQILRLGLPLYIKRVPKQFERIEGAA